MLFTGVFDDSLAHSWLMVCGGWLCISIINDTFGRRTEGSAQISGWLVEKKEEPGFIIINKFIKVEKVLRAFYLNFIHHHGLY